MQWLHTPARHAPPDGHFVAQAPQLLASLDVFTHVPPQFTWLEPQQMPLKQFCPAVQAWPHAPQLAGLLASDTQLPLHEVVPAAHVHAPLEQTDGHATGGPHCPLKRHTSTALPEHRVCPGVQRWRTAASCVLDKEPSSAEEALSVEFGSLAQPHRPSAAKADNKDREMMVSDMATPRWTEFVHSNDRRRYHR